MLTNTQVKEIFLSEEKTAIIATQYGVSTNTVRAIKRRQSHTDITRDYPCAGRPAFTNRPILDADTIREIYRFSGTPKELKAKYGVSKRVAMNIKFNNVLYLGHFGLTGLPGEIKLHKLTWDDVCTIRASNLAASVLSELFGVCVSTINNIRSGRTRALK